MASRHVMAKLNMAYLSSLKSSKTDVVLIAGVTIFGTLCPGTSLYHLVPKHLRATWPRPEQSHLPEACSPNGADNRQQHQRRTKRPPEPSDILKLGTYWGLVTQYMYLIQVLQVNRWRLNPIANPLIELLTGIKILIVKSKMAAV